MLQCIRSIPFERRDFPDLLVSTMLRFPTSLIPAHQAYDIVSPPNHPVSRPIRLIQHSQQLPQFPRYQAYLGGDKDVRKGIDYGSQIFKEHYNKRTSSERVFSRLLTCACKNHQSMASSKWSVHLPFKKDLLPLFLNSYCIYLLWLLKVACPFFILHRPRTFQ